MCGECKQVRQAIKNGGAARDAAGGGAEDLGADQAARDYAGAT